MYSCMFCGPPTEPDSLCVSKANHISHTHHTCPHATTTNDRGRELLVGLACSAFFGMLVMLVSKELVADIAIQVRFVWRK